MFLCWISTIIHVQCTCGWAPFNKAQGLMHHIFQCQPYTTFWSLRGATLSDGVCDGDRCWTYTVSWSLRRRYTNGVHVTLCISVEPTPLLGNQEELHCLMEFMWHCVSALNLHRFWESKRGTLYDGVMWHCVSVLNLHHFWESRRGTLYDGVHVTLCIGVVPTPLFGVQE